MNKMPWFRFYPSDWIKGTRELSEKEKAIWIDLLCYMWESQARGKIVSSWQGISRMVGIPWLECESVIRGMMLKGLLNLTDANGIITLTSRRMEREEKTRESNRLRQRKFYKSKSNAKLTDKKSEVRSHITTYTPNNGVLVVKPLDSSEKIKTETDVQKVVKGWKILTGIPIEGEASKIWDSVYFARFSKSAKQLITLFGYEEAINCMEYVFNHMRDRKLDCTLETIVSRTDLFREKLARRGQ